MGKNVIILISYVPQWRSLFVFFELAAHLNSLYMSTATAWMSPKGPIMEDSLYVEDGSFLQCESSDLVWTILGSFSDKHHPLSSGIYVIGGRWTGSIFGLMGSEERMVFCLLLGGSKITEVDPWGVQI